MGILKGRIKRRSTITRDVTLREAAHDDVENPEKETRPAFVVTILWPTQQIRAEHQRLVRSVFEQDEKTGKADVQIKSTDEADRFYATEIIKGWTGLTVDTLINWLRISMSQTDIDEISAKATTVPGDGPVVVAYDSDNAQELWINAFDKRFKLPILEEIARMDREDRLEGSDLKEK